MGRRSSWKFTVRIAGVETPVEVLDLGRGRYRVNIEKRPLDLEILDGTGPTRSVIDQNGRQYEVILRREGCGELRVSGSGSEVKMEVMTRLEARARHDTGTTAHSSGWELTTPLPGKIKHILVKIGDAVEPGDALIVMEAMKMENELAAPSGGKLSPGRSDYRDRTKGGSLRDPPRLRISGRKRRIREVMRRCGDHLHRSLGREHSPHGRQDGRPRHGRQTRDSAHPR